VNAQKELVRIALADVTLAGDLVVPPNAAGLVLFVHGSGSSRRSPRNIYVSQLLHAAGFGTLLFDLLSEDEGMLDETSGHLRFDIPLLSDRLEGATRWVDSDPALLMLPLCYFGASTGAAAALIAAAKFPGRVAAVVSRGGRVDMAADSIGQVLAPTLCIVGEADPVVVELNESVLDRFAGPAEIEIVPGATHLFEEPGALDRVARLAIDWFQHYVEPPAR
jgi:dienelactone hydrolase